MLGIARSRLFGLSLAGRFTLGSIFFVALFFSAIPEPTRSQANASGPDKITGDRPASGSEGQIRDITIRGEKVCLKRRNQSGSQRLNCAVGFRGDDERFYGLRDTDPSYRNISGANGIRMQITGTLWPSMTDEYVEVGIIEIREAKRTDDPRVLVGKYVCLPFSGSPEMPRYSVCAVGIKTRGGLYWALENFPPYSRETNYRLRVGDQITVEGEVADLENKLWKKNPLIEDTLRVTSVKLNSSNRGS